MLRYDKERAKQVLGQLSAICDPLALMAWIDKRTRYGDRPGPEAWTYTAEFLARYNKAEDLEKVIEAFGRVGVTDEVDGSVWLAEHNDMVP